MKPRPRSVGGILEDEENEEGKGFVLMVEGLRAACLPCRVRKLIYGFPLSAIVDTRRCQAVQKEDVKGDDVVAENVSRARGWL